MRRTMKAIPLAILLLLMSALIAGAAPIQGAAFQRTWNRTDLPVASGAVVRTWMWGPTAYSGTFLETYDEGPAAFDHHRQVIYFDKSRMEITDPNGDQNSIWYVTNGLLVVELVTGRLQLGNAHFEQRSPAAVPVAGDPNGPTGPTYATFTGLLGAVPNRVGQVAGQIVNRNGTVQDDPPVASLGVTYAYWDDVTQHNIAAPFWAFMNASGTVFEDGAYVQDQLFENPFYATGRPITEAYWANVQVAGSNTIVLVQCFERRCLTYTPANPPEWQVEMGNVGQHYYSWRYGNAPTATSGDAIIWDIHYDSDVPDEQSGEWVTIQNSGDVPLQLQGWRLEDAGPEHSFTFPSFVLAPGQQLTIHNCTGTNDKDNLYTGECQAWWNNSGDTAHLFDAQGNLIAERSYP